MMNIENTIKDIQNKGYIVEHDYDGDSDTLERYLVQDMYGRVVRRNIYSSNLADVLMTLPSLDLYRITPKKIYVYDRVTRTISEYDVQKVECHFAYFKYDNGKEGCFYLRNRGGVGYLSRNSAPDDKLMLVSLDKFSLIHIRASDAEYFRDVREQLSNNINTTFPYIDFDGLHDVIKEESTIEK